MKKAECRVCRKLIANIHDHTSDTFENANEIAIRAGDIYIYSQHELRIICCGCGTMNRINCEANGEKDSAVISEWISRDELKKNSVRR